MANFNVIEYVGSLIGYPIRRKAVTRIVTERGIASVSDWTEIDRRTRNLVIADLLMVLFTSPSNTGSRTKSHGDFTITVGGTILTDKKDMYDLMMKLYQNPDSELWENLKDVGEAKWMD